MDFFLDGVAIQAHDAVLKAKAILDLQREFHEKVSRARNSALLLKLIEVGILQESSDRAYNKPYLAPRILALMDSEFESARHGP